MDSRLNPPDVSALSRAAYQGLDTEHIHALVSLESEAVQASDPTKWLLKLDRVGGRISQDFSSRRLTLMRLYAALTEQEYQLRDRAECWYRLLDGATTASRILFLFFLRTSQFQRAFRLNPDSSEQALIAECWCAAWPKGKRFDFNELRSENVSMLRALGVRDGIRRILRATLAAEEPNEKVIADCLQALGRPATPAEDLQLGRKYIKRAVRNRIDPVIAAGKIAELVSVSSQLATEFIDALIKDATCDFQIIQQVAHRLQVMLTEQHLFALSLGYDEQDSELAESRFLLAEALDGIAQPSHRYQPLVQASLARARDAAVRFFADLDMAEKYAIRSGEPLTELELRRIMLCCLAHKDDDRRASKALPEIQLRLVECLARQYGASSA